MLLPVLASAALVLSAPFMAQLRTWLGNVFEGSFVTVMAVAIGTAVAAVAVVALVRIRTHRRARFATIGLALTIAAVYSRAMSTGWPEVDIVERVHFVEYGLITLLFYRAWRPAADVSVIVVPNTLFGHTVEFDAAPGESREAITGRVVTASTICDISNARGVVSLRLADGQCHLLKALLT